MCLMRLMGVFERLGPLWGDLESGDLFGTVGALSLRLITLVRVHADHRVEDSAPPGGS